jgi:hypothetical protein
MQPNEQNTPVQTQSPSTSPASVQPDAAIVMGQVATDRVITEDELQPTDGNAVRWEADEYISPDKNTLWYVILGAFVAGVVALDVFVLKAWTVSVLIVVIAVVLVVMSVRPARKIQYSLTNEGLYIGTQLFRLSEYRAFGVVHDGKENSIFLIPVQRFRPGLSVYFPLESGEAIVDSLGKRLPMQDIRMDFIDQIVKFLRI